MECVCKDCGEFRQVAPICANCQAIRNQQCAMFAVAGITDDLDKNYEVILEAINMATSTRRKIS